MESSLLLSADADDTINNYTINNEDVDPVSKLPITDYDPTYLYYFIILLSISIFSLGFIFSATSCTNYYCREGNRVTIKNMTKYPFYCHIIDDSTNQTITIIRPNWDCWEYIYIPIGLHLLFYILSMLMLKTTYDRYLDHPVSLSYQDNFLTRKEQLIKLTILLGMLHLFGLLMIIIILVISYARLRYIRYKNIHEDINILYYNEL